MSTMEEEKKKKQRKQKKRMAKVITKAWELGEEFHEGGGGGVDSLTALGQKLDQEGYRLGRHGYEAFAQDLGGIYNQHVHSKSKLADVAKEHLKQVKEFLGHIDESLAKIAVDAVPKKETAKKRKAIAKAPDSPSKKKKKNTNKELAEREERALENLAKHIVSLGGSAKSVADFSTRVTKKPSDGRYDVNFYDASGKRFRSMTQVARHFGLADTKPVVHRAKRGTKQQEAEKKKLRKELERLRKMLQRANKNLEDSTGGNDNADAAPVDDRVLLAQAAADDPYRDRFHCAAARKTDIDGFPGIPENCVPDVLMSWDFLGTFQRLLALSPVKLDDFATVLAYQPPSFDQERFTPVYLVEAHLALIKLLLDDPTADDWWWSTLETDEVDVAAVGAETVAETMQDASRPIVKLNVEALFNEEEEPLMTTSWLTALDAVVQDKSAAPTARDLKSGIKTALKVMTNKWARAYLLKVLELMRSIGPKRSRRAVAWLMQYVRQARPDLSNASMTPNQVATSKKEVIDKLLLEFEGLPASFPTVTEEDAADAADAEEDEEESDEESDEEDTLTQSRRGVKRESEQPASAIPPRPLPTLTDLLLPPDKPTFASDFVNAFSWQHVVGAVASRILHRKKRALNEIDDMIRESRELDPISVPERRSREAMATGRTLTECVPTDDEDDVIAKGVAALCDGADYLSLSVVQRAGLLRLLIEGAYDTTFVHREVISNYDQRHNAMKSLEQEQRKARKSAKEKAAADEAAARQKLADELKEHFIDEKREEMRKLSAGSNDLTDDVIDSLDDDDILEFDEDYKADYDALPGPESFPKTEVAKMVIRMREEAAFDTEALRVVSLRDILDLEQQELNDMEVKLTELGGEDALNDPTVDNETAREIDRLLKEIDRARVNMDKFPALREEAIAQLKDAMEDGTMKVLRSAMTAAKKAKLQGADSQTGGLWAVDLLRNAALEFEKLKQNKKVIDAQKELIAKRNRCFIRSEPVGTDRFGNRFWTFTHDEQGHVWVETEYLLGESSSVDKGFVNISRPALQVETQAKDMEGDLIASSESKESLLHFSRAEHHSSGQISSLARRRWGCQASEESLRAVIKGLNGSGKKEGQLKADLKDILENLVADRHETAKPDEEAAHEGGEPDLEASEQLQSSGDDAVFSRAKQEASTAETPLHAAISQLSSAIGRRVRIRIVVNESIAHYENGNVTGWRMQRSTVEDFPETGEDDGDVGMTNSVNPIVELPMWRVATVRGHVFWLNDTDLVESLTRHIRAVEAPDYFERDAAYLAYRNTVGKFSGRANEAGFASSPSLLAKLMIKKEAELYSKLKTRNYDNSWGGKNSGLRAEWISTMKDSAYELPKVKNGLISLESAIFEMTGGFTAYPELKDLNADPEEILSNPTKRIDIELETLDKSAPGLWNSPASRAVFIYIVSKSETTGFLALALDLLCRNTRRFLRINKLLDSRPTRGAALEVEDYFAGDYETIASRRPRRPGTSLKSYNEEDMF